MSVVTRPCREELEALVRHYHHLESEHERAHPEGSVPHHLELRLPADRERFERLLAAYVPDGDVLRAWRDFLHHRGGEPSGSPAIRTIVFREDRRQDRSSRVTSTIRTNTRSRSTVGSWNDSRTM